MNKIPEKYETLVNQVTSSVKTLVESSNQLLPMAHLFKRDIGGDLKVELMAMMFRNEQEKDLMVQTIAKRCQNPEVELLVMTLESWMYKAQTNGDEAKAREEAYKHGSIADHPERVECLMLIVEDRETTWMGVAPIEAGRKLGTLEWIDSKASGRFAGLMRRG